MCRSDPGLTPPIPRTVSGTITLPAPEAANGLSRSDVSTVAAGFNADFRKGETN
jgi:hypothetical protein